MGDLHHDDIMNIAMITIAVVILTALCVFTCIAMKIQNRREAALLKKAREASKERTSQVEGLKKHTYEYMSAKRNDGQPQDTDYDNNNTETYQQNPQWNQYGNGNGVHNTAYENETNRNKVDLNQKHPEKYTSLSRTHVYDNDTNGYPDNQVDINNSRLSLSKDHDSRPSSKNSRVINVQDTVEENSKHSMTALSNDLHGSQNTSLGESPSERKLTNRAINVEFPPESSHFVAS